MNVRAWKKIARSGVDATRLLISHFSGATLSIPGEPTAREISFVAFASQIRHELRVSAGRQSEDFEAIRGAAVLLALMPVPDYLESGLLLLPRKLWMPSGLVLRGLDELFELIEFFVSNRANEADIEKWLKGSPIMPRTTRAGAARWHFKGIQLEIGPEFRATNIIPRLLGRQYQLLSMYAHNSASPILAHLKDHDLSEHLFDAFNSSIVRALAMTKSVFPQLVSGDLKKEADHLHQSLVAALFPQEGDSVRRFTEPGVGRALARAVAGNAAEFKEVPNPAAPPDGWRRR